MYKNYFYLFRCLRDLSPLIQNEKIVEIYTQEKDILFINITKRNNDNFHLVISANPHLPYLTIKEQHHKAKRNTKNFFDSYLPDRICNVELAFGDRIIKITLSSTNLYFLIRGLKTNVVLADSNGIINSFKKISTSDLEQLNTELRNVKFIKTIDPIYESATKYDKNELVKMYRFLDKEIIREVDSRSGDWNKNLIIVIQEIINERIAVFENENSIKPAFCPNTFKLAKSIFEKHLFINYFDAVHEYLKLTHSIGKDKLLRNELDKFLSKEIEKIANKLNDLKIRIENCPKEDFYFYLANLLLANIHILSKGMQEIELTDFNKNTNIKISLDSKLSPQKNIEKYFKKAKSEKVNFQKSLELYKSYSNVYKKMISAKNKLEKMENLDELKLLKKELHIRSSMKGNNDNNKYNFRHFTIDEKYHLYVGKDSKNNDLLTTKFAKQNDLWFHSRGSSGSHVILRVENSKEVIPKNILKKAASIAAFYSKAKTSKLAPVSYTYKKYVVKKKGLDPGQVLLLKEQVLLVQPEIPIGCEQVSNY